MGSGFQKQEQSPAATRAVCLSQSLSEARRCRASHLPGGGGGRGRGGSGIGVVASFPGGKKGKGPAAGVTVEQGKAGASLFGASLPAPSSTLPSKRLNLGKGAGLGVMGVLTAGLGTPPGVLRNWPFLSRALVFWNQTCTTRFLSPTSSEMQSSILRVGPYERSCEHTVRRQYL